MSVGAATTICCRGAISLSRYLINLVGILVVESVNVNRGFLIILVFSLKVMPTGVSVRKTNRVLRVSAGCH